MRADWVTRASIQEGRENVLCSTEGSLCSFSGIPQVCRDGGSLGTEFLAVHKEASPAERTEQVEWTGNPRCEATS